MRYTHFIAILVALLLAAGTAFAEDTGYDICFEDFMESADASGKPMILYTAKTSISLNMRSEPDLNSESLGQLGERKTVQIWGFDQDWLFCWHDEAGIYYIRRRNVDTVEPVSEDVPPYGVIENRFIAATNKITFLKSAPSEDAPDIVQCPAETRVSIWMIRDGWAVIPYNRLIGYMYVGDLKDLTPIAPNVDAAQTGDVISAFTTF